MAPVSSFFWYELMTTDVDAARDFYGKVIGWRPAPWGGSDMAGKPYTVMSAGERGVAGIMNLPDGAKAAGMPPAWTGYISTTDTDAATRAIKEAGGTIHHEPTDIPGVGRFSVVADPQGAMFMLLNPEGADQPPVPGGTVGHVSWRELYTSDWEAAMAFYSHQFGWRKDSEIELEGGGVYALFSMGDELAGGMMNMPAEIPVPNWQFYFTVEAIDAALARVRDGRGKVLMEPMQVPGGSWIAACQDPQGAHFSLTAAAR